MAILCDSISWYLIALILLLRTVINIFYTLMSLIAGTCFFKIIFYSYHKAFSNLLSTMEHKTQQILKANTDNYKITEVSNNLSHWEVIFMKDMITDLGLKNE